MLSELPTKLPLTLKAYVLTKDNLNTLEQWHPAHHVVTEAVNGGEVTQTVLCNEGQGELGAGGGAGATGLDGEPAGLLGGVADFVFRGQSFVHDSILLRLFGFVMLEVAIVWVQCVDAICSLPSVAFIDMMETSLYLSLVFGLSHVNIAE